MAFPVIEGRNSSTQGVVTEHIVDLPAGIISGELLKVFFTTASGSSNAVTFPAGWTEYFEVDNGTNAKLVGAYRQADGTEGASITVTTSLGRRSAHTSYRISGAEDPATQVPEVATATGFGTDGNPPSLTPTEGAKEYLWLAGLGLNANDSAMVAPANYANLLNGATANPSIGTADRSLNAASEDPGTFTSISGHWVAATVAVHPAGAAGIVLLDGTAAAVSSLAGALPVDKELGGTVPAVAALSGDLPVDRLMVSTVAAVSSFTGVLPVDKGLASTVPATSSLAGALALEWALAGIVPVVSTLAGDLTVPGEIVLSGVIPATSSLAGELPVERLMVSTIAAASTLDAILGKYRAINGSIDAASTLTGDLQRLRALAGAIAGGSTLAGALKLQWALRGIIAGLATVSGDLSVELGFPWKRENLLNTADISGPALRAPHRKEIS